MADHRARRDLLVFVSYRAHRKQRSRLRIMNAATDTAAAGSARFGTFALVFGICFAILYVVCEMGAFPMFTYHPGIDRIDPGFAPPRRDEGPAMYWYGWIATSALGASILGFLGALLPEKIRGQIPLALAWVVPVALVPVVIYSLRFYWRSLRQAGFMLHPAPRTRLPPPPPAEVTTHSSV